MDALYAETERNMGQIAKVTHGVCAYYFRTAPELTEKPEGFFYGKRPGTESIEKEPLTDLSIYDPSDTEHVGWYYQPQAAEKIASGNLNVELPRPGGDEIGVLTRSFEMTVSSLKQYIASMNNMAFTDPLTQVKNKTAYDRAALALQDEMNAGRAKFGLIMLDLNRLKYINDHFGHDRGDEYIVSCAKLICDVFKRSPVFRVGGDEFIVILTGENLADWERLMAEMDRRAEESHQAKEMWKQLSIAKGIAFYGPEDQALDDVFVRADHAMYADKKKMKEKMGFPG